MNKRPLSITILACLYLVIGTIGFAGHFREILLRHALQYDDVWIELTELIAIVCGAFLLHGRNWARWLALAWIAFHVAISFDSREKLAVHTLFLAVIAFFFFRRDAKAFFHRSLPSP